MMPVEEACKMTCFTLPSSKIDNAHELQEKLYDGLAENDE
jgi:hypothetical protein